MRRPPGDCQPECGPLHVSGDIESPNIAAMLASQAATNALLAEIGTGTQISFPLVAVAIRELVDLAESESEG